MANRKADFYVAANGDDDWSGTLAEPNAQGTDGPFASLHRAQQAVRERIAAGLEKGVRVLVRGGTYYLEDRLFFSYVDSGTTEHAITWAAYPGEDVNLVGGRRATEWTRYKGEIWEASIPDWRAPRQVFENGRRMETAHMPKEGYYTILKPVPGKEKTAFKYRPSQLEPEGGDLTDAFVYIWPGHDWFSWDKPIRGIDVENYTITLGSRQGYNMIAGNRYVVKNSLSLLTQPGECHISKTRKKVYVWPTRSPIEEQAIVISRAINVIAIHGSAPDKPVRNLHLEGFNLSIANRDVIEVTGAEDCSIRFCKIEGAAECGVKLSGHAQRVTLYGNLIRYNGYDGVSLQGLPPGQEDVNHHNVIENNHIHHCGELVGHGAGVHIRQSGFNRVVHNHIHHMPRYGTTIKGVRYQVLRKQVPGVTFENRHEFLHSRSNLIAYNDIHHVNLDSQDTGAMESWGPGRDNVYDHNLIHEVGNDRFNLQSGMYLDDATDYFTVSNNIIWGVVGTGRNQCVYAKGIGNKFANNVFVVGPTNDAGISSYFMADERCDQHEYVRSIFCLENPEGAIYDFYNWSADRVAVADNNIFWKPLGDLYVRIGKRSYSLEEWRDFRGAGYDEHSLVADPLFVDPGKRNYHLREGSPALEIGFEDIDTGEIGLEADFPERFERE